MLILLIDKYILQKVDGNDTNEVTLLCNIFQYFDYNRPQFWLQNILQYINYDNNTKFDIYIIVL